MTPGSAPASDMDVISAVQTGQLEYQQAVSLQKRLVELRKRSYIADVLLLVEHPPVITLGRNARADNLLASSDDLQRLGIEVAECDRGGDITYHGPGQLVGYPIVDLHECVLSLDSQRSTDRKGIGPIEYVRALEEVLIRTAAVFRVSCRRIGGLTGVWTEREPSRKIAAIGVHISRGVTSHGFALNVANDLAGFSLIVPCGITERGVSSLSAELGRKVEMERVAAVVQQQFGIVFQRQILAVESIEQLLPPEDTPVQAPEELRQLRGERAFFRA